MKSFIRTLSIIIVMVLILAGSVVAQNDVEVVNRESVTDSQEMMYDEMMYDEMMYDEMMGSNSSDTLVQLETVLRTTTQQYGGGKVLVIPTTEMPPQDMVTLMEDMTVMCRIFDKKLAQAGLIPQTPPWVALTGVRSMGNSPMEAMYVQGYGALFMINVDFPLTPTPETQEEKDDTDDTEEATDQVWEQMKQEIFSPQQTTKRTSGHMEQQYDAQKVKNLKTTLTEALVHVANIRGLKPDEFVILTVTGKAGPRILGMRGWGMYYGGNEDPNIIFKEDIVSSQMVMVIRVKKSYIDALAQNKIDYDEFEQKIQLISYPSLGYNIGGRSSSSFWPTGSTGYTLPSPSSVNVSESSGSNQRRSRSRDRSR